MNNLNTKFSITVLACSQFVRSPWVHMGSSKGSQSFWSKVSLLHYHKLGPIHMSVEESIELHALSRVDSKVEVNTDA